MRNVIALIIMLAAVLSACDDTVAYHHYEKIDDEGWDVRDTVTLRVDTVRHAGTYSSSVCVRATSQYPYRKLSVMIYQTVYHKAPTAWQASGMDVHRKSYKKGLTIVYTLPVEIKQEDGIATGQGITYYTYEVPYTTTTLNTGDSLAIVVRHHMRREVLPGITDIGIKLTKK